MIFLKNVITALLSTIVTTFLFALFQSSLSADNSGKVLDLFILYSFYIGIVYFVIGLPFSLFIFSKVHSYSLWFLFFSLAGIVIGLLFSLYMHSELPVSDAERIYLVYITVGFIASNIYLLIYLLISKATKKRASDY